MARGQMYVLDCNGAPVACSEAEFPKWSDFLWSMGGSCRIDSIATLRMSTCFMGLDLRRDDEPSGEPLLWETAITMTIPGGSIPVWIERHATEAAAFRWHQHALAILRRQFESSEDRLPS